MQSIDFKRFRTFCDRDVTVVRKKARETLIDLLVERKDRAVLFLVSGGSALDLLTDMPGDCISVHTTIGVLDERFSTDPMANNFALLEKTDFFQKGKTAGAHSIDTRPHEGEGIEGLAMRFEAVLRSWCTLHPDGAIIITQGIGPDGHTAGIMPFLENEDLLRELFLDDSHWVRGYDAGTKNQYPLRVTTTLSFLKLVDYSIVYCVGENKREALSRVYAKEGSLAQTPARIIREMKEVGIFTDLDIRP